MTPKAIELQIIKTLAIPWKEIKDFQPEGFKSGSPEGIKKSILSNQLLDRFKVFTIPKDKTIHMFDGHTRSHVMKELEKDKEAKFPVKLEVDFLQFPNLKAAAKALLEYQAGKLQITQSGILNLADQYDLNSDELFELAADYDITIDMDQDMAAEQGEAKEDDYVVPDKIITDIVLGDLFEIGQHRLLCGSSLDINLLDKLFDGTKPDMVYADPPYGISVVSNNSKKVGGGGETKFRGTDGSSNYVEANEYKEIIGDETTETAKEFYQTCIAMKLKNIILWGGNYYSDFVPISRCWFVWDKEMTGNFSEAEIAWTSFQKGGIRVFKYLWNGLSREGSRRIEGTKRVHPTQKPVGLAIMIFQRFDFIKSVFDGFIGSGTTMVAAHESKLKCFACELEPEYCQITIDRMLKLDSSIKILKNGKPYERNNTNTE